MTLVLRFATDVSAALLANPTLEHEKPLFIPLAGRWFDAFERGAKTWEYRRFGPRWNKQTCRVGRRVVLSRGYGKQRRRSGTIVAFRVLPRHRAPKAARAIYPRARCIAAIKIMSDTPVMTFDIR